MDNTALNKRRYPRIKCERTASLIIPPLNHRVEISTAEISRGGFSAVLPERIAFGSRMYVTVALSESAQAELTVHPVWADEENNFGFAIEEATPNWKEFVVALE